MGKLAQQLGGQSQVKVSDQKCPGKKVVNMKCGGSMAKKMKMKKGGSCGCDKGKK